MGTQIRPEISKNKDYYILRHRYYELEHFCLQYDEYQKRYREIMNNTYKPIIFDEVKVFNEVSSVERSIMKAQKYADKINAIDKCAMLADPVLSYYILQSVTKGKAYSHLNPPCGKNMFYDRRRKFFWLLDRELG